jgi:putative spermidine/putrescine transport system substrate-binding protein
MPKSKVAGMAGAFLAVALTAAPAWAAASDVTLRIGCYGGIFTEVARKFTADLFTERTGIKVEFIDASPKTHLAKLVSSKGREVPYDIIYLDEDVQVEAIDAGVVAKLDPAIVTNLANVYPAARNAEGYGPAVLFASIGIAYNYEKLKAAGIPEPQSWADLYDAKLIGHVSLPSIDNVMGRVFIVASAKLVGGENATLEKGVEIASAKPNSYYLSSTDLQGKFDSGDVWAAPWINGRAWSNTVRGKPMRFIMPKEGGYADFGTIDVVAGSPHLSEAQAYLNFALDPLPQLAQAYELTYGPSNSTLAPLLTSYPALGQMFPSSPEDLEHLNHIDWRKFAPQYPKLLQDWNRKILNR